MGIYLLIGVIYAFFNRSTEKGWIGFGGDVLAWPFFLVRTLVNKNEGNDKAELTRAKIRLCHDSMQRFHYVLSDTILEETGKGLSQFSEPVRMGIIVYEIQGSLATAKDLELDQKYHRDFATAVLTRGKIPHDYAAGMVDAVMQDDTERMLWVKQAVDGEGGYKAMLNGPTQFVEHIKEMIAALQTISQEMS